MVPHHYREKLSIGLLLLGFFAIRCFYLDTVPRWDAASYWGGLMQAVNATKNLASWHELPKTILDNYNVYGHPAMGYIGLLVIGQLIDFPNQFILNFTHILLALLSVFSVYKILCWFLPEKRYFKEVMVATAAYAMEPLFFGCSIYLNTDFPVLVFFTVALACLLYGRYGYFAIASLFMIFSKEPGIIFWITMVGGLGLYVAWTLLQSLRARHKPTLGELFPASHRTVAGEYFRLWPSLYRIFCLLLPGIAFKLFTIAQRGAMWVGDTGFKFDSNGWNCFGFNPRVMFNRAGEMFVLNFHWVPTLIVVVAILIGVGRLLERKQQKIASKKIATTLNISDDKSARDYVAEAQLTLVTSSENKIRLDRRWGILPILLSFLAFVAFNISYITYIIPRYVVPSGFFLILFTVLATHFAFKSQKVRLSILILIFLLFTVQTFRTVDPLSKLAFGTAPFGKHEILQIDSPGEAVGNGFVYNAEFTAVDKLFNLMQKAMPLKPDTQIIAWNADNWYPWFYMGGVFVDPVTLNRTIDWRGTFHYNVINITDLQASQAPNEAFYVYMPWLSKFSNEQQELAQLSALYQISEPNEVGFQGYNLRFYRLVRLR